MGTGRIQITFQANAAVANGLADTLSFFIPVFKLQWIRILFFALLFGSLAYSNTDIG